MFPTAETTPLAAHHFITVPGQQPSVTGANDPSLGGCPPLAAKLEEHISRPNTPVSSPYAEVRPLPSTEPSPASSLGHSSGVPQGAHQLSQEYSSPDKQGHEQQSAQDEGSDDSEKKRVEVSGR
jgi:hypothetical protein